MSFPERLTRAFALPRRERRVVQLALGALLWLAASPVFAAGADAASTPDEPISLGWQLVKTAIVLGIVVGLIYVTLNWGLRKLMGVRAAGSPGSLVSVVERVPLDQKRAVFVVKVAEEYLLLGGGDASLNLLAKLDHDTVEGIRQKKASGQATLSPFLMKLLSRRGGPPPPKA